MKMSCEEQGVLESCSPPAGTLEDRAISFLDGRHDIVQVTAHSARHARVEPIINYIKRRESRGVRLESRLKIREKVVPGEENGTCAGSCAGADELCRFHSESSLERSLQIWRYIFYFTSLNHSLPYKARDDFTEQRVLLLFSQLVFLQTEGKKTNKQKMNSKHETFLCQSRFHSR
ncbi:unnamed protein product [Nezara viridula]|uniref:Uncharacterized protein n=1 Tax=Nezara viridula TaxID=85310 RepID=A0A9P0MSE6_NEZVI|nr:unnamed protein product [Nezara viridula]